MKLTWHIFTSILFAGIYGNHAVTVSAANLSERQLLQDPTTVNRTTTFWAIADIPYTSEDGLTLASQLPNLDKDVDFLIHLGDIKSGKAPCNQKTLDNVDSIMKLSPVPVLMIIGDNEFNDCDIKPERALDMWRATFVGYETKYWEPRFRVHRMKNRPEVFCFYRKRAIFFGLNLVGGSVHDSTEWNTRHTEQLKWVTSLLKVYTKDIDSVVIFAQANPSPSHNDFIIPLADFFRDRFPKDIPILYLAGDSHIWSYEPGFKTPNWLKVILAGGMREPINLISVDPKRRKQDFAQSFNIERFLS
jgi:hypothetical protein